MFQVVQLTSDYLQAAPISSLTQPRMNDVQEQPMLQLPRSTNDDQQTSATSHIFQALMNETQTPTMPESNQLRKKGMQNPFTSQHAVPQCVERTSPPAGVLTSHVLQQTQLTKQDAHLSGMPQPTKLESDEFQAQPMSLIYDEMAVNLAHIWNSFSSVAEMEHALLAAVPQNYDD